MSCLPPSKFRPLWIACALALAARAEAAGKAAGPQAWMLSFNYGGGNLSMEGDSLGRDFGMMSQLSLGHIVRRGVVAGFQARNWSATETDSVRGSAPSTTDLSRKVLILAMTATVFPKGSGGYVRGGFGVCKVRREFLVHDPLGGPSEPRTYDDSGFAVTAAGGWERKLRSRLGVAIDVEYSRFVAAHIGGDLFSYALGLNYYW